MKKINLNGKEFLRATIMINEVENVTYINDDNKVVTNQDILQELEGIYEDICFNQLVPKLPII